MRTLTERWGFFIVLMVKVYRDILVKFPPVDSVTVLKKIINIFCYKVLFISKIKLTL